MRNLTLMATLLSSFGPLGAGCSDSHGTGDTGPADSGTPDGSTRDSGAEDSGPPPGDYDACDYPADCLLTATTCCGVCGRATASDMASVNRDRQSDYYNDIACPEAATEPPLCPGCAAMPNPNLVAGCTGVGGTCSVIDIENSPEISGCTRDDECIVRAPTCCECGADTNPYSLVAVSREGVGNLLTQICDPRADCPACAPIYPDEVSAVCVDGLCRIVLP